MLDALTSAYKRALMNKDSAKTLKAESYWIDRLESIATEYNKVIQE
jgi:hypothetical protein